MQTAGSISVAFSFASVKTRSFMSSKACSSDSSSIFSTASSLTSTALDTSTVRSVFIIDPNKKLRLQITYPASTGRNFHEILRVIDSLQLTDHHSVATPVNWTDGEDCVVVPSISTEDARAKFPKGVTEIKPYLRMTPQPNK